MDFDDEEEEHLNDDFFLLNQRNSDDIFDYAKFKQSYSRFKMPGSLANNTKVCLKIK